MTYEPDGWSVLLIRYEDEVFYKIFGSWAAKSMTDSDSWRLSSGASCLTTLEDNGEQLCWPQSSGSCYKLRRSGEHSLTGYNARVLEQLKVKIVESGGQVEVITLLDPADGSWCHVE